MQKRMFVYTNNIINRCKEITKYIKHLKESVCIKIVKRAVKEYIQYNNNINNTKVAKERIEQS